MKTKISIVIIILMMMFSIQIKADQSDDQGNGFTVFSLSWLPKFCQRAKCGSQMYRNWESRGANYFTIHGYWPGGRGFYECMQNFEYKNYKTILSNDMALKQDMINFWPDSKKSNRNQQFWEHQWNKHGTCYAWLYWNSLTNKRLFNKPEIFKNYFKQSIKKYKQLNFPDIQASQTQKFQTQQQLAERLLNNLDSKYFFPTCSGNQISQIHICYSYGAPGTQQLIQCPQRGDQCKEYPIYLIKSKAAAPMRTTPLPQARRSLNANIATPHAEPQQQIKRAAANSNPSDQNYEVLSLTWLPQFCSHQKCLKDYQKVQRFTIHGFWPQGRQFIECNDVKKYKDFMQSFTSKKQKAKIKQLTGRLNADWPNVKVPKKNKKPFNIWEWEWNKHGTCYFQSHSDSGLSQKQLFLSYFEETLKRFQNLKLSGVKQRNFKNISSLAKALNLKTTQFYPKCSEGKNLISEIIICYSKAQPGKEAIIDCPATDNPKEIDDRKSCPQENLAFRTTGDSAKAEQATDDDDNL